MSSPIACFSGRIGSGKTSVSRAVADALGASWGGFGDYVRSVAALRSLEVNSREVLQELGADLLENNGPAWLCQQVIRQSGWDGQGALVLDGIRHTSVLDALIEMFGQERVVLLHLQLPSGSVSQRSSSDSNERHSTERDVLDALPSRARLVLPGEASIEELAQRVLLFLGTEE